MAFLSRSPCQTVSEVQMIAVDVVHVKEIQRFIIYADPYERVGGYWSLEYPGEKARKKKWKPHS